MSQVGKYTDSDMFFVIESFQIFMEKLIGASKGEHQSLMSKHWLEFKKEVNKNPSVDPSHLFAYANHLSVTPLELTSLPRSPYENTDSPSKGLVPAQNSSPYQQDNNRSSPIIDNKQKRHSEQTLTPPLNVIGQKRHSEQTPETKIDLFEDTLANYFKKESPEHTRQSPEYQHQYSKQSPDKQQPLYQSPEKQQLLHQSPEKQLQQQQAPFTINPISIDNNPPQTNIPMERQPFSRDGKNNLRKKTTFIQSKDDSHQPTNRAFINLNKMEDKSEYDRQFDYKLMQANTNNINKITELSIEHASHHEIQGRFQATDFMNVHKMNSLEQVQSKIPSVNLNVDPLLQLITQGIALFDKNSQTLDLIHNRTSETSTTKNADDFGKQAANLQGFGDQIQSMQNHTLKGFSVFAKRDKVDVGQFAPRVEQLIEQKRIDPQGRKLYYQ